jgi:carbon-monoxide dehydrogenase medium subunit
VARRDGERAVAAADLFTGAFRTSLGDGELITAVRVPRRREGRTGMACVEVARRAGDLPVCGAGAVVTLDDAGAIASVRVALCGVGATPVRATAVEEALTGIQPSEEAIAAAGERAARGLDPPNDPHGSAAYRRHLAVVTTRRSVRRAARRVQEGALDA